MGNVYRAFASDKMPENYFRYPVTVLKYLGIDFFGEETVLYSILSKMVVAFAVVSINIVEICEIFMQWPNIDAIIPILSYLITHITGGIKIFILYINRKTIGNVLKKLHKTPFAPNDDRTEGETKLIRNLIKSIESQIIIYLFLTMTSVGIGFMKFLYSWLFLDKEQRVLPYVPTMSCFDYIEIPWFLVAGFYYAFAVNYMAALITTIYILLASILAHISRQMIIVSREFRSLKARAERSREGNPGREIEFYMRNSFVETITHHLKNFELVEEMESLCNIIMLMVFLSSVALICFLLYYTVSMPLFSIPFIQNLVFSLAIACHIGMYCFWGDVVSVAAADIANAAADIEWFGFSKDFQKSLIMVIIRAQRPLHITAGKFVPLSINTFIVLMKGSMSYFMFLRQTTPVQQ